MFCLRLIEAGQATQTIEEGMCRTSIIIHVVCSGNQHGYPAGCNNNCQRCLFQIVGSNSRDIVLQRLLPVLYQRLHAHAAHIYAKRLKMLQLLALCGNADLIIFGVGIADPRPEVLLRRMCNDIRVNKNMYR